VSVINRIADLIKANINDLIEKAEDPEKVIKQVILDIEEDLKQLKSQLAVSIADRQLLEKRARENRDRMVEWMSRAESSIAKKDEQLARVALERYVGFQELAQGFEDQLTEQNRQVEELKALFNQLEQKLMEARSTGELLMAQHRRARTLGKVGSGGVTAKSDSREKLFEQIRQKSANAEAVGRAGISIELENAAELESTVQKLRRLEKEDKIDNLLAEIKARKVT
jgi:phage shock protein A